MRYLAEPAYALRYDKEENETEMNYIPDLLTEGYLSGEEDENIRPEFRLMREIIEIARENKYDLDLYTMYGFLEVAIYKKLTGRNRNGIKPLMPLFSRAEKVDVFNHISGRVVVLTALYPLPEKPKKS